MRTLEEIKSELDLIDDSLQSIASIVNKTGPYISYDISTWNAIVPTTAGRINTLQQDIIDAANSVAGYIKNVAAELYIGRRSQPNAKHESSRSTEIIQALSIYADAVDAQADRLNDYQTRFIERAKRQGAETIE
ncbi:hypothetical protein IKG06_02335 [Candidatus Saccharibacteria bacterium]|nr:hypothetical protein [Candidatus Saccharibacteria bacterium]